MPLATAEIAWIDKQPKQGNYGPYQGAKFKLIPSGEEKWINFSPGAAELERLRQIKQQGNGMVTLLIDEKNKAKLVDDEKSLVEQAPSAAAPTTAVKTPLNELWDDDTKRRMAEFAQQEAKLLRYIWGTVGEAFGDIEHSEETQRAMTNSIYIQLKRDVYR